jgi:hypothetical protein
LNGDLEGRMILWNVLEGHEFNQKYYYD